MLRSTSSDPVTGTTRWSARIERENACPKATSPFAMRVDVVTRGRTRLAMWNMEQMAEFTANRPDAAAINARRISALYAGCRRNRRVTRRVRWELIGGHTIW